MLEWIFISSVQLLSHVQLFLTPRTTVRRASLSITNSWNLFKLMPVESVMPSNHLILCQPSPLVFNLSQHWGLFQRVSSHQVAKVLEFQLQHQSFQWIFRTDFLYDWFDLLAVQGTLKRLLQHHSWKTSILWNFLYFALKNKMSYLS